MINLFRKLIGFCEHKWVIKEQYNAVYTQGGIPQYIVILSQCEKCGKLKKFRV